ncbi:MAG: S49 family peptidase [Desulfobulbus sp.]
MRYMRLAERLFNRPLMITESKLNTIQHIFSHKSGFELVGVSSITVEAVRVEDKQRRSAGTGYQVENGVAIIGIYGPLMHRVLESEFPSGGPTTYGDIRAAFDLAMIDDDVTAIVLDIDSPGGEVSGVFDLADHIYQARGTKPLTAIANESAFSAAYLLASATDRIVLPRTAGVGSIGVIATHADFSRAEDAAGVTVTHVYAGDKKANFSPHQPLSVGALADLQEMVDESYQLFVETVARNRRMSVDDVIATQAGIYEGKKAIKAKLADEVSAVDKAFEVARGVSMGDSNRITPTAMAGAKKMEKHTMNEQEMREKYPDVVAAIEEQARQGMIAQADAETAKKQAVGENTDRLMTFVTAAVGEESSGKIKAAHDSGLSMGAIQKLGVDFGATTQQSTSEKMLDAITNAAADGIKAGGLKPKSDAEERKSAASMIAAAGSVH